VLLRQRLARYLRLETQGLMLHGHETLIVGPCATARQATEVLQANDVHVAVIDYVLAPRPRSTSRGLLGETNLGLPDPASGAPPALHGLPLVPCEDAGPFAHLGPGDTRLVDRGTCAPDAIHWS
jgi:hypothetical protein